MDSKELELIDSLSQRVRAVVGKILSALINVIMKCAAIKMK